MRSSSRVRTVPAASTRATRVLMPLALLMSLTLLIAVTAYSQTTSAPPRSLDVPYVPTPQPVVDRMLEIAKVSKNDVLYDLGSGDGRTVITAAKKYGATGVGIDLDPERIAEAKANAKKAGVEDRVKFIEGNLFKADLSNATVVTLYLLNSVNRQLRPQLWKQLPVGTRVVSHAFDMGAEWPPERVETVSGSTIYYWTIKEEHKKKAGSS